VPHLKRSSSGHLLRQPVADGGHLVHTCLPEPPGDVPCDCHAEELLTFDAEFAGLTACPGCRAMLGGAKSFLVNAMNINRRFRLERLPGTNPVTSLPYCDFYYKQGPRFPGWPDNDTFDIDIFDGDSCAGAVVDVVDSWECYGGPAGLLYVTAYSTNQALPIFRAAGAAIECVDGFYVETEIPNEWAVGDCQTAAGGDAAAYGGTMTIIPVHV
jgi:hypothetical protein